MAKASITPRRHVFETGMNQIINMSGQVTSVENKSTEMDLIDLVCIQIHFPFVLPEECIYLQAIGVVESIGDAEITEDPIL
jgi:hypothetical protein